MQLKGENKMADKLVGVRFTKAEWERVKALADKELRPVSNFIKMKLFEALEATCAK